MEQRTFYCADCNHTWSVPFGTGRPQSCPECGSNAVHRKHGENENATEPGQAFRAGAGFGGRGSCCGGRAGRNRGRQAGRGAKQGNN